MRQFETDNHVRSCGCTHRYQPQHKGNANGMTVRQRSQSATPLRSVSRPTTPTSISQQTFQLTEELRSLSETNLNEHVHLNNKSEANRARSSRASHWSRRTPEELARLARLRSSSRSPVSLRGDHTPGGSTVGSRPGSRLVGTGYGHSYSLPRPFDTTPTGIGKPPPQGGWGATSGGKFERSRAPSQSGANYYRGRNGRSSGGCSCCSSGCQNQRASKTPPAMSEMHEEHVDDADPAPQKPRYVSEMQMEPRFVPSSYGSTALVRIDSTWSRFVEEIRFQKCLVPVWKPKNALQTLTTATTTTASELPPTTTTPNPPRRCRIEVEVRIGERPEGRQPIEHIVQASA